MSLHGNVTIRSSAIFAPFIHQYIKENSPVQHHIQSFDELIKSKYGIRQIITEIFSISNDVIPEKTSKVSVPSQDDNIDHINLSIKFVKVNHKKPYAVLPSGERRPMYPQWARNNSRTYSAPIYVDIVITVTAYMKPIPGKKEIPPPVVRTVTIKDYQLASLPIMVRSTLCNTHGMCVAELIKMQEDPHDKGGYFIIQGRDFAVSSVESVLYNALHVQKNVAKDELVRGVFISKPGDGFENSYLVTIRLHSNMMITLEFGNEPLVRTLIPFYLIFRMFGITSDMEIIDMITHCADPMMDFASVKTNKTDMNSTELRKLMNIILANSITDAPVPKGSGFENIKNSRVPENIIQFIANKISRLKAKDMTDNNIRFNNTELLKKMDTLLFPHMGGINERIHKLKLFGHCIEIILKVHLGVMDTTDRDSYLFKRILSSAFVTSKELKRIFNNVVIKPARAKFIQVLKTSSFGSIDLAHVFANAVKPRDLETAMERSIISGKKTISIGQQAIATRITSQDLSWKNMLFIIAIMRTISPSAKPTSNTSTRAIDMRAVHPSTTNFICPSQTPETGDNVGKPRQMALLTRLTLSTSSEVMTRILKEDPNIYPLNIDQRRVLSEHMSKVFINGRWIGYTDVLTHTLAKKYREKRRRNEIDIYTSIYVNVMTLDIYFSTEQGRLITPLLIVVDTDKGQDILLTDQDLNDLTFNKLTIADLEKRGVFEYLTPEEQDNAHIAEDYNTLRENAYNPQLRYTHCQIPQAILGYTALTSPFGNYTDTVRVSYMTNHTRQACGWPTLNYAYRCERKLYVQTFIENPLVQTIVTPHTYQNGTNLMVAYCPFEGFNQEDSAIFNKSSAERGACTIHYYTYLDAVMEKGEQLMNPNAANTQIIINANYDKIERGLPKIGTIINQNDVVIGRVMESNKEGSKYIDHSVVYKRPEPAIVEDILLEINSEGKSVHKVKLRTCRRITQGDKVSSRYGNKSIASNIIPSCELPYTEDGEIPDIIIDSQGISKRMLLGQINEGNMAVLAAKLGTIIDGTTFSHIDHDALAQTLKECGVVNCRLKTMYNGRTGEPYQALICMCSNYYLRLQKFIIDGFYAVGAGPTDALTRQPLRGKSVRGGLRLGEMEKDCFCAHGCMMAFRQKFCNDSDGCLLYICRCGVLGQYNAAKGIYSCRQCQSNANLVCVSSTWMHNIHNHQLNAAHIGTRFHMKPIELYQYEK